MTLRKHLGVFFLVLALMMPSLSFGALTPDITVYVGQNFTVGEIVFTSTAGPVPLHSYQTTWAVTNNTLAEYTGIAGSDPSFPPPPPAVTSPFFLAAPTSTPTPGGIGGGVEPASVVLGLATNSSNGGSCPQTDPDISFDVAGATGSPLATHVLGYHALAPGDMIFTPTTTMTTCTGGSITPLTSGGSTGPLLVRILALPPVAAPTSVPTMNEWGMILFTALAGLGSVYYLRRKRRTEG